jgi:hypothetical protein
MAGEYTTAILGHMEDAMKKYFHEMCSEIGAT